VWALHRHLLFAVSALRLAGEDCRCLRIQLLLGAHATPHPIQGGTNK